MLNKGFRLKPAGIILRKKEFLLPYFLFQDEKNPQNYTIEGIIFDKNNPFKLFKKLTSPIWKQKNEWEKEKVFPVGIIKIKNHFVAYWQNQKGNLYALLLHFSFPEKSYFKRKISPFFYKFPQNPILKPTKKHSWESKAVFNTAAVKIKNKIHFIYRAVGENDISVWGYAASNNGFEIEERSKKPIFSPLLREKNCLYYQVGLPFYVSGGGFGGCEDPRISKIGDTLYITYTDFDGFNPPNVALTSIKVDDFLNKRWNFKPPVKISPPNQPHKNWVIFPQKIKGKYAILHSISPEILIDYFNDLDFDGKTFIRSYYDGKPKKAIWEERIRGVGPPPIKTTDGWLIFYHAMDRENPTLYKIGTMILDLNQPTKILYRASRPVLEPSESYENEGLKPGIVYSCGAVVLRKKLFLYYGGADTVGCVASAPLNIFLNQLKSNKTPRLTSKFRVIRVE